MFFLNKEKVGILFIRLTEALSKWKLLSNLHTKNATSLLNMYSLNIYLFTFLYINLTQDSKIVLKLDFFHIFSIILLLLLKVDNTINSFNNMIPGVNIRIHIIEQEKINRAVACDIKLDANKHLGCNLSHKNNIYFWYHHDNMNK